MSVNNSSDIGQPDARPFEFIRAMESLKDPKELVRILHIESYSIVSHE